MTIRSILYTKAEANGNDFLLIEADAVPPRKRSALARAICSRHRGIGADGVEFVRRREAAEIELILFNADGGEAEVSGNGTRCAAAFCAERYGFTTGTLKTGAGTVHAHIEERQGSVWWVELRLGQPHLDSESVPMLIESGPRPMVRDYPLEAAGRRLAITALSMGNPQCCVLVDAFPEDWEALGAALESHPAFPRHVNVEFVRVLDPHSIEIRIYERGVGPTESSGTGSCAAAVAAILHGRASSPVTVASPGGVQVVNWTGGDCSLRGPARLISDGAYYASDAELLATEQAGGDAETAELPAMTSRPAGPRSRGPASV
jgi:diaminopimelate epimerase